MKRIAIITTHPIQYYAPLFRLLSKKESVIIKVFYTWSQSAQPIYDPGFKIIRSWDIPLLEGYEYQFVNNISKDPGSHHFMGIVNPDLTSVLHKFKPDVLFFFGWSFKSHLSCMFYFKGKIPIIFRGDSTLLDEKEGLKKTIRRIFLTWVYRYVDYALYVGQNNKSYFLAHGLKENKLIFAPHAIDNQRFIEGSEIYEIEAAQWRKRLGIENKDLVLLFAGKLEEKKNPHFLLRLAKSINSKYLKIIIIGNGDLENDLKQKASEDQRIIFLDFQNQTLMPVVYRMADIFILPSVWNETWGLAVNEAMACKRPVIASTKVGCVLDLVQDGLTGWSFEPGRQGEIKVNEIVKDLLQSKDILLKMGENAAKKISEYSFSKICEAVEKLVIRL